MAELTVPSKKRRALADALMNIQGPQAQMVGNQMVYSQNAGLLSGLAQGIGGYLKGKEYAAGEAQAGQRRDELARLLGGNQVSGGASGETDPSSPSSGQPARPASLDDFRRAAQARILAGDDEGATQFLNYGKAFTDDPAKRFNPDNYIDPKTGKVMGGQYDEQGNFTRLPFPIYKAPSSSYDPVSGALIQTGGLPLEMVDGYAPAPAAPGAAPQPAPASSRVIDLSGGKETPQARKLRLEQERQARAEQRDERRLSIAERQAGEKEAEKQLKVKGAQVNYEIGEKLLSELEQMVRTTDPSRLVNPTSKEYAKAKSLSTQLGDIYRSKEFADLGVINPADLPRIEAVVADPTSWRGALQGKGSQLERINQMRQMLKNRRRIVFGDEPATAKIGPLRIE